MNTVETNPKAQEENPAERTSPPALVWAAAIVFGLFIGFGGAWLTKKIEPASPSIYHETAPDFTLELFESEEQLSLNDLRGKGVVVNFWASWCFPCREEMPALEQAWQKYKDKGVVFVGINIWNENLSEAKDFLKNFSVTYPNGVDLSGQIVQDYNVQGVPTTWFISPDGVVMKKVMGPLKLEELDQAISNILPEN